MKHLLRVDGAANPNEHNEYEELVRMFLRPSEYELNFDDSSEPGFIGTDFMRDEGLAPPGQWDGRQRGSTAPVISRKDLRKRALYDELCGLSGRSLPWGILTGVKPLKLYDKLAREMGVAGAEARLRDFYRVSERKLRLLSDLGRTQRLALTPPKPGAVSIYVGIPFCPSRCAYCSFPSNPVVPERVAAYLCALEKEIGFVSGRMEARGLFAESVYIGGGTPTALSPEQLESLLLLVKRSFPGFFESACGAVPESASPELTVESGRPETLTADMCEVLMRCGVSRVCVNPQSLNDATLVRIGRNHDAAAFVVALRNVRAVGITRVNTDIIAGLPGETEADFMATLEGVLRLSPDNLTVHTLSLKKGSALRETDGELCYETGSVASRMLEQLPERLAEHGYRPYYLYRQKRMLDNLENVGYALPGSECVYNMRTMEEKQTIIALGAGASSKLYFPEDDRIERVFNVSDCGQYVERIDEMIARKHAL
jgi:oxygen-independent coproporphyrinogen-3 oxidase